MRSFLRGRPVHPHLTSLAGVAASGREGARSMSHLLGRPATLAALALRHRAVVTRSTTVLCVRKGDKVVMVGDGQVSQGPVAVKGNARKVRRIGNVVVGFAGSTADAFTLVDRLERKLEENQGQLTRACVELAKAWRTDKYLRRLEASLVVADASNSFELDGYGNVLEPEHGVLSIGSGSAFAIAAARALMDQEGVDAEDIARKAMAIAADMCVYTNTRMVIEVLKQGPGSGKTELSAEEDTEENGELQAGAEEDSDSDDDEIQVGEGKKTDPKDEPPAPGVSRATASERKTQLRGFR